MTTEQPSGSPASGGNPAGGTPVRLSVEQWGDLAALVAPYLRDMNATVGAEDPDCPDLAVVGLADAANLVTAMHAAGVLVYDDATDRAHLRKIWAAMSTALYRLAENQPLTPDVLAAVPASHRIYLMGHEAGHRQLSTAWQRMFEARGELERLLRRGTTPTPAEIGEVLAALGGENPYVGERPADVDPWWGCWTVPGADTAVGSPEDRQRQINERARQYGGAIVVHRDGSSEILRHALRLDLLPELAQLPEGARAYALPWPAGTRAVYDPVSGVEYDDADEVVISRDLFVSANNGGYRCLLGQVRRLEPHEKRHGPAQRYWECRYCHLGTTGSVSVEAERAECLGHEAICPDRDRMDLSIPRTAVQQRPRSAISPGDPDWVEGLGPVPGASLGVRDDGL